MRRRAFLFHAAAGASTTALTGAAPIKDEPAAGLIDTNVYLSRWPTLPTPEISPVQLAAKLRLHGVTEAWTGTFDGVLTTDIAAANARLAATCARDGGGVLRPFGTVNPVFPDWEEDLRRCHEVHRMAGVRVFPNYHRYTVDDRRFVRFLQQASVRGLLVQIPLTLEDDRAQNPALTAPPVNAAPLVDVLARTPGARVMLLNAFSRAIGGNQALLRRLTAAGVGFEIATLEGAAGIENLLRAVPGIRLAFGSYSPAYTFEAAQLKLQESELSGADHAAVCRGHAHAAISSVRAVRPGETPAPSRRRTAGAPAPQP